VTRHFPLLHTVVKLCALSQACSRRTIDFLSPGGIDYYPLTRSRDLGGLVQKSPFPPSFAFSFRSRGLHCGSFPGLQFPSAPLLGMFSSFRRLWSFIFVFPHLCSISAFSRFIRRDCAIRAFLFPLFFPDYCYRSQSLLGIFCFKMDVLLRLLLKMNWSYFMCLARSLSALPPSLHFFRT